MMCAASMQRRICHAVEQTIGQWIQTVAEAEAAAIPGNKARLLHLQRNMMQARDAIGRILEQDDDCQGGCQH